MKFKPGNRVEVLRRNETPHGSWFPAKILSVDGSKYNVGYDLYLTTERDPVVEKVHEEDVRPHPLAVQGEERWILGDIVEVFDLHSWRGGKIMKVLHNSYFVIRIFDSIQLKEFHVSSLRVRQSWHNNRWVMIGKDNGMKQSDDGYTQSSDKYTAHLGFAANDATCEESCTGERVNQDHDGKKRKANSKVVGYHRRDKRALHRKVDAVSFSNIMVREHTSTKERNIKSTEMGADIWNTKMYAVQENNECSIASCSGNYLPEYREIPSSLFGDATSSCPLKTGEEYPGFSEDKLAANIHELELHAYQSTVQALYASGPLSWEQESLLTNLRLSLNISNEEHLLQLRTLLSA